MEQRDSAGQILFTTTLEEELQCPNVVTDDRPEAPNRAPSVYVFNPFAEAHIARGLSFTPTKHQALLARDLANLPQFLGRQDDIVLLPRRPSVEFLRSLQQAGFPLPEFVELDAPSPAPSRGAAPTGMASHAHRPLGRLRPWAWGPDSVQLLQPLFPNVTGEDRLPAQRFHDGLAQLYSKAWSAEILRQFLAHRREPDDALWLCSEDEVGVPVSTLADAEQAIQAIRRRGHHKIVVKEALGLAGHNSLRLWEPAVSDAQRRWMDHALQDGRLLVIEPWLERALDFSVQLEMGPHGLQLCGCTGLINDLRGQFQANTADAHHPRRLPAPVLALLREPAGLAPRLQRLYADLCARLEAELRRAGHAGPVSLDAFIYRTPSGPCRLKPVVEINPRYTMGRLTVELMKQTSPGSSGTFRLVSRAMAQAEGGADFPAYAAALRARAPLRLDGAPASRIREGALCLNDPAQAQVCLAVFQVSRTPQAGS